MSNNEYIIEALNLQKIFKVHQREKEGFVSALKSLVNRKYKLIKAVAGIDFKVRKGEIRGLIGPNGAGKSTTIKMLCGILYPTEGEIKVLEYTPWLQRKHYVKRIGAVFGQKSQLIPELPAIDTFAVNREIYKIPKKRFKENVAYYKELLDIDEVVRKPVRQLSLGERMKCELVCALLHDPELVFLDEPTIGLDIISKEAIRNFIRKTNREKKTTYIITTHDLDDIENLCENITIINNGKVVYNESLENIKNNFFNKKIIEIKFSREINRESLAEFKLLSYTPFSVKIEIDLAKCDLKNEISKLLSFLPVHDININYVPIEEVIKYIYNFTS